MTECMMITEEHHTGTSSVLMAYLHEDTGIYLYGRFLLHFLLI